MAAVDFQKLLNDPNTFPQTGIVKINSNTSLGSILTGIIPLVFTISGIALLVFLIIGGLGYMTAGSDPKKAESAKAKITSALVGFVIIFVSYWIVQIIGLIFDIKPIQQIFR